MTVVFNKSHFFAACHFSEPGEAVLHFTQGHSEELDLDASLST